MTLKAVKSYLGPALEIRRGTNKTISVRVHGDSMKPIIRSGDHVRLRFSEVKKLRQGDIIALLEKEYLVVHRLMKKRRIKENRWFCHKGDNLSGWKWVHEGQVLGRVESIEKSHSSLSLTSRPWRRINLVLGCVGWVWITLSEIMRLFKVGRFGKERLPVGSFMPKWLSDILKRFFKNRFL